MGLNKLSHLYKIKKILEQFHFSSLMTMLILIMLPCLLRNYLISRYPYKMSLPSTLSNPKPILQQWKEDYCDES